MATKRVVAAACCLATVYAGCVDEEPEDLSESGRSTSGLTEIASFEAESMTVTTGNIATFSDAAASGGKAKRYWTAGTLSKSVSIGTAASGIVVRARGEQCNGAPQMSVRVDGVETGLLTVAATTTWTDYSISAALTAGTHTVDIAFPNDAYVAGSCDRNLLVDRVSITGGTVTPDAGTTDAASSTDAGTVTPDAGTVTPDAGTEGTFVLGAVGDINPSGVFGSTTNPGRTAQAIRSMNPTYFLGVGDFQYTTGTLSAILGGYDKNFGDLKPRTLPTAGPTHDVASASDQLGYQSYWGRDAFKPYSVNLGNWHIVSLPSAVYRYGVDTAGVLNWLKSDLAANTRPCTLAFWHEPYWSRSTSTHPSSSSGVQTSAVKPWVDALYQAGAELIINGHQHNYQRFAPMRPDGTSDPNGVREILSGAGGIGFYTFTGTAPNVEASNDNTYGVLKLTLRSSGYDWQFVPNTTGFTDSGSAACH
jgi:hypothetical protein